jgi:hypothetical protein
MAESQVAHTQADASGLANSYGPEVLSSEYRSLPEVRNDDADDSSKQVLPSTGHDFYAPDKEEEGGGGTGFGNASGGNDKKTILGLSSRVFWTIAAGVAALIIVGVALGAGLGIGLAQHNSTPSGNNNTSTPADSVTTSSSSSTSTSTATSTSSAPVTSGTVGLSDNSCNTTLPKTYHSKSGTSFTQYCFTDWPRGDKAADGNGTVTDLSRTTVYTFEDCMEACLTYNAQLTSSQAQCTAVTYNSNLTSIIAVGKQGGNCFFKNKKGVDLQGSAESACAAIAF